MARNQGQFVLAGNFEPEAAAAFDARANIPTKVDLTIASN